jgi:hypothetical protein
MKKYISYTTGFKQAGDTKFDFRYKISPKAESHFDGKEYFQVFNIGNGFVRGLSIVDLLFNMGPDAVNFL